MSRNWNCNCPDCQPGIHDLVPAPCSLCGADGVRDSTADTFGCSSPDGHPDYNGCHFALRENFLPPGVWNRLGRSPDALAHEPPQLPECKANKNHHALHLVAEKWERLDEGAMCGLHPYQQAARIAVLMAETCRAIASTTCEMYAPGPAGSDADTTCSGRGLPECATCGALEARLCDHAGAFCEHRGNVHPCHLPEGSQCPEARRTTTEGQSSVWVPGGPEDPAAEIARNPDHVVTIKVDEEDR